MNISAAAWGICLTLSNEATSVDIRHSLIGAGFNLVPLGDKTAEHSIMFEFDRLAFREHFRGLSRATKSLVIFEPKAVNPSNYSKSTRRKFAKIWTPTELMAGDKSDIVYRGGGFYAPVEDLIGKIEHNLSRDKKFDVAIVNENKFSLVGGSHYTLRADALVMLMRAGLKVGLAGKNWDRSSIWHVSKQIWHLVDCLRNHAVPDLQLFRNRLANPWLAFYEGKTESVIDFYGNAKFALIIENESVYVTEKLFNALASGAVPVYVGPKLGDFNIPEDVAVQAEPNVNSILESISNFDDSKRNKILEAGLTFLLHSETESIWLHRNILNRLAKQIWNSLKQEEPS